MKNYFLKDGSQEKGPFMLDDLKYQRIRKTTEVKIDNGDWHFVLDDPDLSSLLDLKKDNSMVASSSTSTSNSEPNNPQQANKRLVVVIAVVLLLVSIGMAFAMLAQRAN